MSLQSRLTDLGSASDALGSRSRRKSLSTTQIDALRNLLLSDSYLFAKTICGHKDLIPELHMPMSYAACGLTALLCETLDATGFDSYVTRKFREELWRRGINWKTAEGYKALGEQLDFLNFRWFRGSFKSSVITHGAPTFLAMRDPNLTIKITHAVDDKAWAFCEQIGATLLSGIVRDLFPDRVPQNPSKDVTMKEITFAGRTISHPQTTIQASGYKSKDEGAHYDTFFTDDLVNEQNSTPQELKGVHRWQRGMPGFYMPTRRIRRVDLGTKHDEDDDDTFLNSGERARQCLTLRVPIEEHEGEITNVLRRGKPTIPQMYTVERIAKLQSHVLSDESEIDGVNSWRCNYLLDPMAGNARLFPPSLIDNPDHWWQGPYEHDRDSGRRANHYLIARYRRDDEGNPIPKKERVITDADGNLLGDWRDNAAIVSFDPWTEMDRVCLVDPAWASTSDEGRTYSKEPDNWGVSAVGTDYQSVAFQLETRSDTTGTEGWIDALADMDAFYHFRTIGFDGAAMQDAMIRNLMHTDKRLRRLRNRMVKVPHNQRSKGSRMRAGLAEPLRMYRFLLHPGREGSATREELKAIRGQAGDKDGIADSLAMHRAVNRRTKTKSEIEAQVKATAVNQRINSYLGVPFAA